tara:strand:+ start:1243 stop:2694 length:1452 start_codon:yes stop_codon:yes gene_type:complete
LISFSNTFEELPEIFYEKVKPTPVSNPKVITFNLKLAEELGIPKLDSKTTTNIFSGNEILKDSSLISFRYAGHQFGNFVNQLGDGRAVLLGEINSIKKERLDIQLKGSGITPFSRQGDGRSALGPVIREYIISEAMFHLGIPTTRALCAVDTGEKVMREAILPGGILTRVARSHIRIGTFEYFASREDWENVEKLLNYCITRHYPEIESSNNKALEFLRSVASRQSDLVSDWMGIGFIHGVMNTDNVSIPGETLDYGPCAFMDSYDPMKVFSSIDHQGRYAFGNQPQICLWNMYCLAGCLMKYIDRDMNKAKEKVEGVMQEFVENINTKILQILCMKIGLQSGIKKNEQSIKDLLNLMKACKADYTQTFSALINYLEFQDSKAFFDIFKKDKVQKDWLKRWEELIHKNDKSLALKKMKSINPIYIPRNHLIEEAIELANEEDFSLFYELNEVLESPFTFQKDKNRFLEAPNENQIVKQTFCGT